MILLRSVADQALNKTMCGFVMNHAFPLGFRSINKRTQKQRWLFDFYAVGPLTNNGDLQGRTCEVHVPASRFLYFTFPYSHLRRSTGILPCGAIGCRRLVGTP